MGKLRRPAKAAVLVVEAWRRPASTSCRDGRQRRDSARSRSAAAGSGLRAPRYGGRARARNASATRSSTSASRSRVDVGAAAQHVAVRRQERRGRPAAEAVALADVGTAIGVDADRDVSQADARDDRRSPRSSSDPSRGCCGTRSARSTAAPACLRRGRARTTARAPGKPGDGPGVAMSGQL